MSKFVDVKVNTVPPEKPQIESVEITLRFDPLVRRPENFLADLEKWRTYESAVAGDLKRELTDALRGAL